MNAVDVILLLAIAAALARAVRHVKKCGGGCGQCSQGSCPLRKAPPKGR